MVKQTDRQPLLAEAQAVVKCKQACYAATPLAHGLMKGDGQGRAGSGGGGGGGWGVGQGLP